MSAARVALNVLLAPPIFLGAALCSGAAVAAQMGRTNLRLDILAHFAPLWLAGGLLALAAGFVFRGYVRVLILGMAAPAVLAAGALVVPEYLRDTGPKAPVDAPDQLKIVQINAYFHADDNASTIEWLAKEKPDIVIMQEAAIPARQALATRTGLHMTCDNCEVAIFSRQRPDPAFPIRPEEGPMPLTQVRFKDAHGPYRVIGVHNEWPTDIAGQQRQEARLTRTLASEPRERTILTGDFNSAPWSHSRQRWDGQFGVIRRDKGLFSWPARPYKRLRWVGAFPFLPIDHVYAGSDWATVSVKRGPKVGSDHYPVVMILSPVSRP